MCPSTTSAALQINFLEHLLMSGLPGRQAASQGVGSRQLLASGAGSGHVLEASYHFLDRCCWDGDNRCSCHRRSCSSGGGCGCRQQWALAIQLMEHFRHADTRCVPGGHAKQQLAVSTSRNSADNTSFTWLLRRRWQHVKRQVTAACIQMHHKPESECAYLWNRRPRRRRRLRMRRRRPRRWWRWRCRPPQPSRRPRTHPAASSRTRPALQGGTGRGCKTL
jgi:hypothetical protein